MRHREKEQQQKIKYCQMWSETDGQTAREGDTDRQTDVQSTNYSETDEGGTDKKTHTDRESDSDSNSFVLDTITLLNKL